MPHRLEIALKPYLKDAQGEGIRQKALHYLGIGLKDVKTISILTIDAHLSPLQLERIQQDIFTNPVTQISSYQPLTLPFDWCIWVGYRPGVKDNPGDTAVEAVEDLLRLTLAPDESIYTSKRYLLTGDNLTRGDVEHIANELLANDIIQQWKIFAKDESDFAGDTVLGVSRVVLNHRPEVFALPIDSDETLKSVSARRNLALHPADIPIIRAYFLDPANRFQRQRVGLSDPTDVELEYISQARSDHCNHNTFQGVFHYTDTASGTTQIIDNLFKTCIETPTLALKAKKPWVISVLWDNAGVGRFDDRYNYVITGETHNSPSNMEAYGGAITGIVGVYRDPMGTGKGSKLVMGGYGYCVGHRDYSGKIIPHLHPKRLLDGVIEGVRDGGNKSGVPTTFGQVLFNDGYIGKSLVFVTAVGIMPATVDGRPGHEKTTSPGDLVVMCGGRVGKDGIHGVTASSESFSETTPAGHVQIGDPYTQKKMHDFLLDARDEGLIRFITDNGGGGLSSSVGESARFAGGCEIQLDRVPLKYQGLDQWEIWISESQERMTVAIHPDDWERFAALSRQHAVESTVIGRYTNSGKLHLTYHEQTCAYVDLHLLTAGFPQWEFEARWEIPEKRGLSEPVLKAPTDYSALLMDLLARPNIAAKEWIVRQYDHEVQGTSVIKPLVGAQRDMNSDASVIRPVLDVNKGLAFAQALLPWYSAIDAFHMTSCVIDEAVRRLLAVGTNLTQIGGVDNFCWPHIGLDEKSNPDGAFKAAQLVRACNALRDMCLAYEVPLLSGKDSMYVDGYLPGRYGEIHKISALETLQFAAIGMVDDIRRCVTMDSKIPGDLVYVLGTTRDELGASEYYDHLGYVGLNVPRVTPKPFLRLYKALEKAMQEALLASVHGIYRGGLGIHLALVAMGGNLGLTIDLTKVPVENVSRWDTVLFSESAGRFIVTVNPANRLQFETHLANLPHACIGSVTCATDHFVLTDNGRILVDLPVAALKSAWKKPFGELI
jgi:phosphoribosylformylglycinamidine synthase II